MLIKVKIENFKSFDEMTELTMISSNKIQQKCEHKIKIKSTSILKYGVVYGANASGKTNLIEFFGFLKASVAGGLPLESANLFCKNREMNKEKESTFEVQITIGDKFYAYGFSAVLNQRRITAEWLYELFQNGSAKCLFERGENGKTKLGDTLTLNASERNRFSVYAEDFAVSGSGAKLFLTEMNRGKKYDEDSKMMFFKDVYDWIVNHIIIITPNSPLIDLEYYYEDKSLSVINQLIQTFDTGINEVKIEEITLEELSSAMPKPIFESVMQHIKDKLSEKAASDLHMTMRSHENFFNIEVNGHDEPKVTTIKLHHDKSFYDFGFDEESDGTRRIFELMDMLLNNKDDMIYVVDELERSLHPKLTEHFLNLFMQIHASRKMQLLFTTHESSIMEQSLFRRDEIWFIERNAENCSNIYSLDIFKERYDKILSKAYLEGRYGAIPVFSSFEFRKEE